jgi:UDP-glucose 4-epimerase
MGSFVYVSSSEVYGIPPDGAYTERSLPSPTTVYGAGKLSGEFLTRAYAETYGLETRIVRPFNSYGPRSHFEGDSGEVIPKFILRALAGLPLVIHGSGEQTRDFMFVSEAARWLVELSGVLSLVGRVVNIGTGVETRIIDLAASVLDEVGSKSPVVHGESRPGDLPRLVADTSLVRTACDFHLDVGLREGLKRTIAWFRDQDVEALLSQEVEEPWK